MTPDPSHMQVLIATYVHDDESYHQGKDKEEQILSLAEHGLTTLIHVFQTQWSIFILRDKNKKTTAVSGARW